jgi:hypothetical protein
MKRLVTLDKVHEAWRKLGSYDCKHVEIWEFQNKRVDILFLK